MAAHSAKVDNRGVVSHPGVYGQHPPVGRLAQQSVVCRIYRLGVLSKGAQTLCFLYSKTSPACGTGV